jgi:hypothetical protein
MEISWQGGQFEAATRPSSPQRSSRAMPGGWMRRVDSVSLGKEARSTSKTRRPLRASNMAVGEPAQRAPTTMASYIMGVTSLAHPRALASRRGRPHRADHDVL